MHVYWSIHLLFRYESFDFHKQCSKERYDRLSILTNRLATDQDAFGYFAMNKEGNVLQVQKGVFRVNCIDCLDRTNVVQGLLAKRILQAQLQVSWTICLACSLWLAWPTRFLYHYQKMNILGENESVETYESLYNKFRHGKLDFKLMTTNKWMDQKMNQKISFCSCSLGR